MKKTVALFSWWFLALGIFAFAGLAFQANAQAATGSLPAKAANNPDPKYGLFICFSIGTFKNPDEKKPLLPASRFAPTEVPVKEWARTAKDAGMTFIILTIKDPSGFCLWDSQESDYSVRNSPVKDDIVKAYVSACLDEGLVPGICYSVPDMLNEGRSQGPIGKLYIDHMKKQLSEVLSTYPQVGIICLDDAQRLSKPQMDDLKQLVARLNPKCVLWSCHDGRSVQDTIIKSWSWNASAQLKMAEPLVAHYQQIQASGKSFVLNVGPDRTGHIPKNQLAVLMEVNKRIAALAPTLTPVGQGAGQGNAPNAKGNTAERLKNLKSLYEQGLINKDDYERKTKAILDEL